ncbi:hypothetical protein SAMN04488541_11022, partial [Thermoflexibacter ruber]
WKFMRKKVIDTCFYRKFQDFKEKVCEFFTHITQYKQELNRLFLGIFISLKLKPIFIEYKTLPHGRKQYSLFKYGLKQLSNMFLNEEKVANFDKIITLSIIYLLSNRYKIIKFCLSTVIYLFKLS